MIIKRKNINISNIGQTMPDRNLPALSLVFLSACLFLMGLAAFAYEDCIITTNGKMTDISIQHNDIIDVFPLITVMNEKNTLIVHPLKKGKTKFSILKDKKDKYIFDVTVTEESTKIEPKEGFDILNIDCPPSSYEYYFDLDLPPYDTGKEEFFDLDLPPAYDCDDFELDSPPKLRGE